MTEAYPLHWPTGWPRVSRRERSRFDASFAKTRDGLFDEIKRMGGRLPVLSSNIPLRRDGLPYANTPEPSDPGVAVYFVHKGNSMVFACDRWDRVRDNVRAIEKTIEAIRGIERWGASDMMERAFSAFEALEAPSWWNTLGVPRDASSDDIKRRYRDLIKTHHPDVGGDPSQFRAINEAYEAAQAASN